MKRMPRGRSQMPYYGQCPDNEMPHMQRGCFTDGYGKMDGPCGMGVSEFKSPMMANADPPPPPPKKKRRTSNTMAAAAQPPPSPVMQDLLPPPLTGYGDTIVASNPFDDTPPPTPTMTHMNPMNHVNKHLNVGPCMSPAAPMMNSMSPCHMGGSPMNCGPPIGSPINCGPPMGNCSPMPPGSNPNCGPVGSPHCNSRQVSRSPLVCPPMSSTGSVMNCGPNSSPLNVTSVHPMNRSPSSLGSPLGSVMASNVRGNSPLDCGLGLNSVGSQKGSPMSVMSSHNMGNLNCGSPMGSPSNVSLNNCNNGSMNMGSPITSPLGNVQCSLNSGPELGMNLNGVMNRSPMNVPPNSVGSPMLCGSSMRGPSPISGGPLGNSPMNINCNPNSNVMGKSDLNMNDLAMGRDNCGPGHMKPNGPNMPQGSCMPMNNISCGPTMNNCNPMMNNSQCGPMNNLPCIGNNMNRSPCGNPMSMGNPYDGMNPQCRPNLNRSQFPRTMSNMHYGGPNNMSNLCGPPNDMNNMSCVPNNNMHCNESNMNNVQCIPNNMNQCSGGNMFNSPFNPFDSRCSPNMHFNGNEMSGMNNGFYRNINNGNAPCIPNMRNSCVSNVNDNSSDISTIKTENRDAELNADITNTVCGISSVNNDSTDDLSLIACNDNFMRDKTDDRKPKDCNGGLLDDEEKLEDIKNKIDDKKDCIKIKDEKMDSKSDDDDSKSNVSPVNSSLSTTNVASTITTVTTSSTIGTSSGTTTTTTATVTNSEHDSSDAANSNNENNNDNEDDIFKSNTDLVNNSQNSNSNSNDNEENVPPVDNEKLDSEEKHVPENENSFSEENNDKNRDDKNINESAENNSADAESGDPDRSKENGNTTPIKMENDEFFDGKSKSDCIVNSRPGSNNFSNGNIIPTSNFGNSEVSNVLNNNSTACLSESMCTTAVLPNMNRTIMSNAMNHSMNFPNSRQMSMYPGKVFPLTKSNVFKSQNPNAPPVYACGHCHKEVNDNDQAVLCESGCHCWYHRTCSGLTQEAYTLLTAEVYAEWVCDKCLTTKNIPLVKFKP